MARGINKLSARRVETVRKPGRHSDGGNLYLDVQKGGAKSWVFLYRFGGKQREMGLGSALKVPLAKARDLAKVARELLGEVRIQFRKSGARACRRSGSGRTRTSRRTSPVGRTKNTSRNGR